MGDLFFIVSVGGKPRSPSCRNGLGKPVPSLAARTPFRCGFMASLLAWGVVRPDATELMGDSPYLRDIANKQRLYKGKTYLCKSMASIRDWLLSFGE
ncbi:MAG TPA: hypothetical protein VL485_07355 [Ktedonobacteraceae bacterium]|nr:hypothetical protein [Ktedonobacteraceae bacterium]